MAIEVHDPARFVSQLRQALSADKLALGFLIGAGCPCAIKDPETPPGGNYRPLIPAIAGLTAIVHEKIAEGPCSDSHKTLMATFVEDEIATPTVEAILNRVRALREVAGKASARGVSYDELDDLDRSICGLIRDAVKKDLPGDDTPYHQFAKFVGSRGVPAVELFTTNYDLLLEQALEHEKVPFFDGFIGSKKPFFDQRAIEDEEAPRRWARLWKLHGSANWRLQKSTGAVIRSDDCADGEEVLIHPSHMKYDESRRMPYFVMIDRLRKFLRNSDCPIALVVVGYAFGDQHLNEAIVEALKFNPLSACFAIQYEKLEEYPAAAKLARANSNLSLLASDAAVIRRQTAPWVAPYGIDPSSLGGAFEITPQPESSEEGEEPQPCTLSLGNFAALGKFLEAFAMYGTRPAETL